MGACGSSQKTKSSTTIYEKSNYDFDTFKNEINNKNEIQRKGFLIKAKLWEIKQRKNRIIKYLLAKYFFFEPNGTIISKVKPLGEEQITYTGSLSEQGTLILISQQIVNSELQAKLFEGVIDNNFKINGLVKQKEYNHCNIGFEFDLKPDEWAVNYYNDKGNEVESFNVCIRYKFKEAILTGLSKDTRGNIWLWCGYEEKHNEVTIIQRRLNINYNNNDEKDDSIIMLKGKVDKINYTIKGTVSIGEAVKFCMKSLSTRKGPLGK
jgi:hypothetical protein